MENNLFKEKISENLYKDVLGYFKNLHDEKRSVETLKKKIKDRTKLHIGFGVLSGSVGLVTIGMAISNNYEIYKVSAETLHIAGVASLAMATISTNIYKGITALRREYLDSFNKGPLQDLETYSQFEKKLVMDLNAAGVPVEYRHVSDYMEFAEMRDLWETSKNVDDELKQKTETYVKRLLEEYKEPLENEITMAERLIKPRRHTPK
jgi:NADPH-dependent 7-cyano-7-deazaguanine reductase QueF-like protein